MKKNKKRTNLAFKIALPILIYMLIAGSVIFAVLSIKANSLHHPGPIATLFNFSLYSGGNHSAFLMGQIISNLICYLLLIAGIALVVLSALKIKHDNVLKAKSIVLACGLVLTVILSMTAGVVDFIGHGFATLVKRGGTLGTGLFFGVGITYLLALTYYVCALFYSISAVREGILVHNGEIPTDDEDDARDETAEDKLRKEEERAERHEQLLRDIRQIVREELDALDRVAIVTETVVEKPLEEEEEAEIEEEPEEVVETEEGAKRVAAPRVPFAKKIVKADKELQEKYNEIKAEILAYGASSRLSIAGDTFRLHRKPYVKITLVGKTLKVYFALNPNDFVDSPIPVVDASDKAAYEEVPALLKVKSQLSVKRAKELVRRAFEADQVEKKEEVVAHNFVKDIRSELRAANKK